MDREGLFSERRPSGSLTCAVLAVAAGTLCSPLSHAQAGAPKYKVDLSWPKPLPDRWVLGGLGGVCVDRQDHVFILNRQDVLDVDLNAGHMAPFIIEIDPQGNVANSWGDPKLLETAFDLALARELKATRREAEAMLRNSSDDRAIWRLHDYLSEKRREIDQKYDNRYSVLMLVFPRLVSDGSS